jgi:hypothetical protein
MLCSAWNLTLKSVLYKTILIFLKFWQQNDGLLVFGTRQCNKEIGHNYYVLSHFPLLSFANNPWTQFECHNSTENDKIPRGEQWKPGERLLLLVACRIIVYSVNLTL